MRHSIHADRNAGVSIIRAQKGVGRLLGLISLQSLPRRLTLDFRDIFSDGLAFDSIEGKTTMTAGVMRIVDALRINSPAAQIEIRGEAIVTQAVGPNRIRGGSVELN